MSTLHCGIIQKLYRHAAEKSKRVAPLVKTVMNTALEYAKNVVSTNVAKGVNLPKSIKKKQYRIRKIDVQKTLTVEQYFDFTEVYAIDRFCDELGGEWKSAA